MRGFEHCKQEDPLYEHSEVKAPEHIRRAASAVRAAAGRLLITGGWVRDTLLGRVPRDLDLEIFGLPEERALALFRRRGRLIVVGKAFPIHKWIVRGASHDLKLHPGPVDLEADAAQRDLRINALYLDPLDAELLDPTGGLQDLRAGTLRHVGSGFGSDSLRKLRVARFASILGFAIDPETLALARELRLVGVARERIFEELRASLESSPHPELLPGLWQRLGVCADWPELDLLCSAGALEETEERLARARDVSARGGDLLEWLLAALMAPLEPGSRADWLARIVDDAHARTVEDLLRHACDLLAMAPEGDGGPIDDRGLVRLAIARVLRGAMGLLAAWGIAPQRVTRLEKRVLDLGLEAQIPDPWIRGGDLIAAGMRPGPGIGTALEDMYLMQLRGEFGSREEALEWARTHPGGVSSVEEKP